MAVERLLEDDGEAITRVMIDAALAGDMQAARFILERVAPPPRKGRPITFTLPELTNSGDVRAAALSLLRSVAVGDVTPEEAAAVAPLIEGVRKAMEVDELSGRLDALEQGLEGRGDRP